MAGPFTSCRVAVACGVAASAASFVAAWMLLVPHVAALGSVYRLAASLPPAAGGEPPLAFAVPLICAIAFLAGFKWRRYRGKKAG